MTCSMNEPFSGFEIVKYVQQFYAGIAVDLYLLYRWCALQGLPVA